MIQSNPILNQEVHTVQTLLWNNLNKKDNSFNMPSISPVKGILNELSNYNTDQIEKRLGEFGLQLLKLKKFFDLEHPAAQPIIRLLEGTPLSDKLCEHLSGKDVKGMEEEIKNVSGVIKEFHCLSVIENKDVRESLRKQSQLPYPCHGNFYSEIGCDWSDEYHDTLVPYVRLNEYDIEDLTRFKEIHTRYRKSGMELQAYRYKQILNVSEFKNENKYCGFYNVSLGELGYLLAKIHGFTINSMGVPYLTSVNQPLAKTIFSTVCYSHYYTREAMFKLYENWNDRNPVSMMDALCRQQSKHEWARVLDYMSSILTPYSTRLYLASSRHISDTTPAFVTRVVEFLESFPDFKEKPLFDHFLVLVPGIRIGEQCLNEEADEYFLDCDGLRSFKTKEEATVFLDNYLIKSEIIAPILIGQIGQRHYPICYWN